MLCTPHEIMSISNHQNMQDVEIYVAKVRKEILSEDGWQGDRDALLGTKIG
tara:strand:- start:120 stop:272 length:153 start_codon:yes stop_codon:yes gene_type:complete